MLDLKTLSPETTMGRLELRVRDLDTQLAFYTQGVGLEPISDAAGSVLLGRENHPIVRLTESRDLRPAARGQAGLFHTAVLYADAGSLARTLVDMFKLYPHTFTGTGDHLVSEAFYFTDPEGNGVELYHDRPRDSWRWVDGHVMMDTLYIDPVEFVRSNLSQVTPDAAATLGHVHLQVGDVGSARQFYVDALGFDETATLGNTALFVSAGGYHHHMAMNTWNSRGAGPRGTTLGMGQVDIVVPKSDDLTATTERLRRAGFEPTFDGRTLRVLDPWRNEISLSAA